MASDEPLVRPLEWNWREAARGAACALPGACLILAGQAGLGLFLTIGVLPTTMLGIPRTHGAARRSIVVGSLFAAAYALGSIVGLQHVVAVVALSGAAFCAVHWSTRAPVGRIAMALLVPAFALGMNEPPAAGLALAGLFVVGTIWAVAASSAFRRGQLPATPRPANAPSPDPRALRVYAVLFAAAAGTGLALGYVLDVSHEAWIAAAAMFIMRPSPTASRLRALQRLVATFLGVLLAAGLTALELGEVLLAAVALAAITAVVATRTSRWYVSSFGSALIVLLLSGVNGTADFHVAFRDRLLETALGAGLAVAVGIIAALLAAIARTDATASAAGTQAGAR